RLVRVERFCPEGPRRAWAAVRHAIRDRVREATEDEGLAWSDVAREVAYRWLLWLPAVVFGTICVSHWLHLGGIVGRVGWGAFASLGLTAAVFVGRAMARPPRWQVASAGRKARLSLRTWAGTVTAPAERVVLRTSF